MSSRSEGGNFSHPLNSESGRSRRLYIRRFCRCCCLENVFCVFHLESFCSFNKFPFTVLLLLLLLLLLLCGGTNFSTHPFYSFSFAASYITMVVVSLFCGDYIYSHSPGFLFSNTPTAGREKDANEMCRPGSRSNRFIHSLLHRRFFHAENST